MGECFFWYRPNRVVPDKRPLNGRVCVSLTKYYVADAIRSVCLFDRLVTVTDCIHDGMIAVLKQQCWQTLTYSIAVYLC